MARCDANVLLTGETGTGKEMAARAIHELGRRAGIYFARFYTDRDRCLREVTRQMEAASWLGDSLVKLRPIPELATSIEAQLQAFPAVSPPSVYPVCYESSPEASCRRKTLRSIYQEPDAAGRLEDAFRRLLEILAHQPRDIMPSLQRPGDYLDVDTEGRASDVPLGKRIKILAAAKDLRIYGELLWRKDWDQRYQTIEHLLCGPIPDWLNGPTPVVEGYIHGEPSSRNCLVDPRDFRDMKLIEVGGFAADGRLVFDLALIEADVKLSLMATEADVRGLRDLNTPSLKTWFRAESHSLSVSNSQITFRPNAAPFLKDGAAARAYRIIDLVRKRAQEVSGDWDPEGRHYFAALLYWTLNSLRFDTIRPTKKLLAIYSASEILRRFSEHGA